MYDRPSQPWQFGEVTLDRYQVSGGMPGDVYDWKMTLLTRFYDVGIFSKIRRKKDPALTYNLGGMIVFEQVLAVKVIGIGRTFEGI